MTPDAAPGFYPDIGCRECDVVSVYGERRIANALCSSCTEKYEDARIQWEYWRRYS